MSNSDLTILSIPVQRVGADLTYTSVTPKEYAGPTVVGLGYGPLPLDRNGIPMVQQNKTYVPAETVTTVSPAVAPAAPTVPVVPNNILNRVHSEGLPNLIPMMPTSPPASSVHSHPATDIYETKDRIWFTPDERVELRFLYSELLKLEADISSLVPKPSRAITFTMPDVPDIGNPIEVRFPWLGVTKEIEVNYSVFDKDAAQLGLSTTTLTLQQRSFTDTQWTTILTKPIVLSETIDRIVVPVVVDVNQDDMFRVIFSNVSFGIKNVVCQLVIEGK